MCSEIAIKVDDVSKCFALYQRPADRLKQFALPRLQSAMGISPKQYYQALWALSKVSFEIRKGETVGIIGRNGSGKSTLLQMICDTLTPSSGRVLSHGRIAALLELGSGFNPEFTGLENIYLNAKVLGLDTQQIKQRLDAILAFADIGPFIDQPVKTYSSGMFVRLAFAILAHVDADILVIDEALAVGDAFFTQKCMRFLREFMQTGTTLFVSHDTASIRGLCTRAIWIDQGRIIADGLPKDICEQYLEAYFEQQQGKPAPRQNCADVTLHQHLPLKDQRQALLNHSALRNDIQIFSFEPDAAAFGQGGARILDVSITDGEGHPLTWVVGGEYVILRITVHTNTALSSPIVGFYIKDRLGQNLFGDNTYLSYLDKPQACMAQKVMTAQFHFQMPRLPAGDYSVAAAVADGTQQAHVQHHWIHDALCFRSESTSVAAGLIGIPMAHIQLEPHS